MKWKMQEIMNEIREAAFIFPTSLRARHLPASRIVSVMRRAVLRYVGFRARR